MHNPFRGRPKTEPRPLKRLFLDDDPERATQFLAEYPDAVWVKTAVDCIAQLRETWDEVHLDHDLGGEQYVEIDREDCGMQVVRWLAVEPRSHLQPTQFYVHSHNGVAAMVMFLHMKSLGLDAEVAPFAAGLWKPGARTKPGFFERLLGGWRSISRPAITTAPSVDPPSSPSSPTPE